MSFVAETVVSVTIEKLVNKLVSEGFRLFQRQEQIRADLNKWEDMLLMIKAALRDADEKQMEEELVKIWLGKIQNLAYDVEDMLDEFEYEALRRKLVLEVEPAADQPSTSSKFRKLIPTCCTRFTPQSIQFDYAMMDQIKEITIRFDEIAKQKNQLALGKKSGGKSERVGQRLPTTSSVVTEAKVHGRGKEEGEIVELLLRDNLRADDGFSVIPITGFGGMGKTTLAQLVFNDDRVKNHFDLKVWACVSEDLDVYRVTRTILSRTIEQTVNDDDLSSLQEKLKQQLSKKKFLLVLDDIWNENYNTWSDLSRPFEGGAPGSKIIVTTRSHGVAKMMRPDLAYSLGELSTDDCRRIFTQHSLETLDFSKHLHLEEIGMQIVMKCKGLPLAAKALGGILRGKNESRDWEDVLNSKIWDLPEERCDLMPFLRVSFYYLSPLLKQCFAYCSLFPKDYEFQKEEIILLWMAEGFLYDKNSKKKMEDLGHQFFDELYSRSFFQQSSSNTSHFVMHDLINDLAQWAAEKMYLRMEDTLAADEEEKFSKNLRHLSYSPKEYDGVKRFEAFYDVKHLRTLFAIPQSDTRKRRYLASKVLANLLNFPRLRVLSLRGYSIAELPKSIGDLTHLRYLDLSQSFIKTLPESINGLYNLHTLILENCYRLEKLCSDIGNLRKLHHLNNSNAASLEEMPRGIGKLTCLRTLCSFAVGNGVGSGLRELKFLKQLRKTLGISRLENVKDAGDAMEAELNTKSNLKSLSLEWSSSTDNPREPKVEAQVLDMLKPHVNLEELTISGYGGIKFSTWLGDSSVLKLVLLKIEDCGMCTSLPSVGQLPVLKQLFICGIRRVRSVGPEFYGNACPVPFPSLETLYFQDMNEWEEWIPHGSSQDVEGFPLLRELSLVNCPKLVGTLPQSLPSLESLKITKCQQLALSIPSTVDLSSLKSVVIEASNQESLVWLFKQRKPKMEELKISCDDDDEQEMVHLWQDENELLQNISSLHLFTIERFPKLSSFVAKEEQDQQQQGFPCRLQDLRVSWCPRVKKLPQALLSLSSLRQIEISNCDSLVTFPEAALPSQLTEVSIWHCDSLERLPDAWMHNTNSSLGVLEIECCRSMTYIARVQIPPSLKRLQVTNCENLRSLIVEEDIDSRRRWNTSLLELLYVYSCQSLTSLSVSGTLPKALKSLEVADCSKLESVAEMVENISSLEIITIRSCKNLKFLPNGLHTLRHLQTFSIRGCPDLACFPEGGLRSPRLTKLVVSGCTNLEALPDGIHNLTSLEYLSFPVDGLFDWGLNRFTLLKKLCLNGCAKVVSFPEEKMCMRMTLPASLTILEINDFPDLERIYSIDSLKRLSLIRCPKLKYFPESGLPTSLLRLNIRDCPLIEERCRKDGGDYWDLIATTIPCVSINSRWIFDD